MAFWRTWIRSGLAVFTVGFGIVVYLGMGSRQVATVIEEVERADPSALIESTGAILTQAKGATQDFRIEAARQLTYADGSSKLEDVHITVSERAGRTFEVTSRVADIGADRSEIALNGDVRIVANDGLTVTTEQAVFRENDGLLTIPGAVHFSQGRLTGSGHGATYDRARDVLRLLGDAAIGIGAEPGGHGLTEVTSRVAEVARADGYMRFDGDVRIVRDKQIIEAQRVHAYFTGADQHIELVELRGGSSVRPRGDMPGPLRAMHAREMDLVYDDESQALRDARLLGDASIEVQSGAGGAGRRVSADRLVVGLGADGATVDSLDGRGNVHLEFEATDTTPGRQIRATGLVGSGVPGAGLTSVVLTGGVEQRETDGDDDEGGRIVSAQTLTLGVLPGLGDLQLATFVDDVEFEDGALSGSADLARYDVLTDTIVLAMAVDAPVVTEESPGLEPSDVAPGPAAPKRRPVVTDARAVIEANTVELSGAGGRLVADGDVKTVMQPSASDSAGSGDEASGVRRSAMLSENDPVYVTATRLDYDRTLGFAVYTGTARLWQGETAIQGDVITIDDQSGDLAADGAVRSSMALTKRDDVGVGGSAPEPASTAGEAGLDEESDVVVMNSVATADILRYDERARRTTYVGKPPDALRVELATPGTPVEPPPWIPARVTGPQGDLRAHKIELFLAGDGSTLERVEAYGEVRLRTEFMPGTDEAEERQPGEPDLVPEPRDARGERLTYFAEDERYLMHGTPVQISERCRETQGKSLTFFKAVDTITVDGNEEIRTQSRAGNDCAEPPSN